MSKYKLIFKRFTYTKDNYGQTKIFIDKNTEYEQGSKALRYLLDYIELLEGNLSKEKIDEIKNEVVNKKYKTKPVQELIAKWRNVIDNA